MFICARSIFLAATRMQVITIPWFLWILNGIVNFLPTALADEIAALMGACNGMSSFKGRGIDWSKVAVPEANT